MDEPTMPTHPKHAPETPRGESAPRGDEDPALAGLRWWMRGYIHDLRKHCGTQQLRDAAATLRQDADALDRMGEPEDAAEYRRAADAVEVPRG